MTVFEAPLDTRVKLRDKSLALGDVAKPHSTYPGVWLVTAQTYSTEYVKAYYKINVQTGSCTCKGSHERGICRHSCRVAWELHKARVVA